MTCLSRLLAAYEADNTETTYYYGAEGLAAQYNSGTGKYFAYHYDNIGSTTLITAKDGHAVERFSYGTYGELLIARLRSSVSCIMEVMVWQRTATGFTTCVHDTIIRISSVLSTRISKGC